MGVLFELNLGLNHGTATSGRSTHLQLVRGRDKAVVPTVIIHPASTPHTPGTSPQSIKRKQPGTLSQTHHARQLVSTSSRGADIFSTYGHEGEQFFRQLFSRYAKRDSSDSVISFPGQLQLACWQSVAVALRNIIFALRTRRREGRAPPPPFFVDASQAPSGQ